MFVGLGFPFEGPAPLEAIASGAVFLNPKVSHVQADKQAESLLFGSGERHLAEGNLLIVWPIGTIVYLTAC